MEGNLKYWLNGEPVLPDIKHKGLKYWLNGEGYVVNAGLDYTQICSDFVLLREKSICDRYSESNYDYFEDLSSESNLKVGQSFTGDGNKLVSCKFYLCKYGNPTGNIIAKIYAHSGTFGVDGIPTGSALASSDNIDVSTLSVYSSFSLTEFTFTGAERIMLAKGTHYFVVLEYSEGDGDNAVFTGSDISSQTHSGNQALYYYSDDFWSSYSDDFCFYVYTEGIEKRISKALLNSFDLKEKSICDRYSESNYNTMAEFATAQLYGQSFTGDGNVLDSCKFYLAKGQGATGTGVAKIYAHTGTFGTDGTPTGVVLATSDSIDISTLSESLALVTFTFTGAEKITLTNGTHYFVVFEPTLDGESTMLIGYDSSSPTHSGNQAFYYSSWTAYSENDLIFYVYNTEETEKKVSKALLNSLGLLESEIRETQTHKTATELLDLSESEAKSSSESISDEVGLIESDVRETQKDVAELLELSESISFTATFEKALSAILNLAESKTINEYKKITDSFNLVEQKISDSTITKTEAITLIESLISSSTLYKTEILSFVENLSTKDVRIKKTEEMSLIETKSTESAYEKQFVLSLALAEQLSNQTSLTQTEAFSLSESLFLASGSEQKIVENLALIETLLKDSSISKTETLALVDVFSKYSEYIKKPTDNLWVNRFGGSLKFDGTNDYVDCGNDESLDITDAITIEVWVKPNSTSGSHGYLISKNNQNSTDQQYAIYTDNGAARYYGSNAPLTPTGVIPYNVWTNVVFIRTSGGTGQFYINGVASGDSAACAMPTKPTFPVRLGCRWNLGTTPYLVFNGTIDEVRIYNRALSTEEIKQAYQGVAVSRVGLVGEWHMDEGSGDTVEDSSNENNNGIRHGAIWSQEGAPRILNARKSINPIKTDSLSFTEFIKQANTLTKQDTFNISESTILSSEKRIAISFLLAEQLSRTSNISLSEALILSDVFARTTKTRKNITEEFALVETLLKENTLTKSEILTLAETYSSFNSKEFADSLNITDEITKERGIIKIDSLSFTEFIALAINLSKQETINILENTSLETTKNILNLFALQEAVKLSYDLKQTETLVIIDEINKKDESKNISDSFNTSDELTKTISLCIINNIDLIDTLVKKYGFAKADAINITEHIRVEGQRFLSRKTYLMTTNKNKLYLFSNLSKTRLINNSAKSYLFHNNN